MSILIYFLCIVPAGVLGFSLCRNLIYWYENLNAESGPIPLPRPGPIFCLSKFLFSFGGHLLCVGLFPFGPVLRRKPAPPSPKDKPGMPPVVLIHGLNNNAAVWLYLGKRLRRAGVPVSTFSYPSLFAPLMVILDNLDAHIRQVEALFPGLKPVIIGHSLGGILARSWLLRRENAERLAGLVTIGSPHQGSKLAVLAPGALAARLVPGSGLIRSLQEAPPLEGLPCTALASPLDEAVLPASSLVPPEGWKLRITAPVGHFAVLFCPSTATMLLEELHDMRGT